jgi:hypothetical protein
MNLPTKGRLFSLRSAAVVMAVAALTVAGSVSPASAAPTASSASIGVVARYGNGYLNLAQSWGTAQSCVMTRAGTTCYSTSAVADAATGAPYRGTTDSGATRAFNDCAAGYLCLWADSGYNGRRLQFRDENWQSLVPYGFQGQTSSWRNFQSCSDSASLGNGQGGILQLSGCASASSMGSWDNQAVDVHG